MGESIVAELKNYATNYYTSGNGEIDLAGALEQLRGRKKILENEIRMEMAQKQQEREKLEQEVSFVWRDVHHLEEELERVEEELAYRLEKEEEKKKGKNVLLCIFAVVGVIVVVAAICYGVYRYLVPDYLEDFDDDFDNDFFSDEDEVQ